MKLLTLDEARQILSEVQLKKLASDIGKNKLVADVVDGKAVIEIDGKFIHLFDILSLIGPYETPHR